MNVIPNPWMAYDLSERVLTDLRKKEKNKEKIQHNLYHIADSLRTWLREQKDILARKVFFDLLKKEEVRFVFFTDSWRPPDSGLNVSVSEDPLSYRNEFGKVVAFSRAYSKKVRMLKAIIIRKKRM
jgi:hypothetical protein